MVRRFLVLGAAPVILGLVTSCSATFTAPPPSPPGTSAAPTTRATVTPSATDTPPVRSSAPPGTRVVTYEPWDGSDLTPGFHESKSLTGFCWIPSMATNRPDAFRCQSNGAISDPCFASPGNQDLVACPYDGVSSVEVLHLDKPLPPPNPPGATPPYWLLTLTDGDICEGFTGLGDPVDNMPLNYECGDGYLYGSPNHATLYWTIYYGSASGSLVLTTKMVRVAYR